MKSAGMLCAGLMLVMTMTGCYHCSYKYNPCTGITEQRCKKVGFRCDWWHKDKTDCGSCMEVMPECGVPECGMPQMTCGCEMPETCGCGIPEVTCSLPDTCGFPPSCGCAEPETCGCGYPPECGFPVYHSPETVYSPTYSEPMPAPKANRNNTPEPAPISPPEDPASQIHYTVPHRHHR